ncbi:universal stress protein [Egbenema bharatensis]|uniref:universal stress protein n=1 Tax=Egbenema bharatensis TaxID=3463334 RepID=UPI003A8AF961
MISRILVALDDSPDQNPIFAEALTLAKQEDAQLMLVHILSTDERDRSPLTSLIPYSCSITRAELVQRYEQQKLETERNSLNQLKRLAQEAQKYGIHTEITQQIGNPRQLICYLASKWGADLIVVGQRQRSWFDRWLLGSVSRAVMGQSPCSVRVVRTQNDAHNEPPHSTESIAAF